MSGEQHRKCWTENGEHYFVRESDGTYVCQICGEVRALTASQCADSQG